MDLIEILEMGVFIVVAGLFFHVISGDLAAMWLYLEGAR